MINEATNSHRVFGFMTSMKPWIHFPLEKLNCWWATELGPHNKRVPRDIGFMLMNSMKQFSWNSKGLHLVWQPIARLQSIYWKRSVSVGLLLTDQGSHVDTILPDMETMVVLSSVPMHVSAVDTLRVLLGRLKADCHDNCEYSCTDVWGRLEWQREHFCTVVSVTFGSDGGWRPTMC